MALLAVACGGERADRAADDRPRVAAGAFTSSPSPSVGAPVADQAAAPESPPAPVAGPALATPFTPGAAGQIVFESDFHGRPKIFVLDLAGPQLTQLTFDASYRDERPVWSPDGQQIAFSSTRSGRYDIWVMNADGSEPTQVTDHEAPDTDPGWAADGRSLYFTSERDGRGELYRVDLATRHVERVTSGLDRAIMPAVSPDGRHVAYAAQLLVGFQIHVLNLETGQTWRLSSRGGACRPAWSPDGQTLAYVLLDEEPSVLVAEPMRGGEPRRLVADDELWSYYPSWSPDGRWLAFSISPEHHEGEDWDLALAPADRPHEFVRLTIGPGNDRLPDWRPM